MHSANYTRAKDGLLRRWLSTAVKLALLLGFCHLTPPTHGDDNQLFTQAEKILVARCFECHIGDSAESGFRLDVERAELFRGGDSGEEAVVPGDVENGKLLELVASTDEDERMPPAGEPLTPEELKILRQWIQNGAKMTRPFARPATDLWSFKPVQKKSIPVATGTREFVRNPIDSYVARRLDELGLQFNPSESEETLIRRLYLVALGVTPKREQVDQFLSDSSDQAYEKLVDRVLSSTEFGERWAQHWLDIVRFGETQGFETNRERPNAWPYRDFVIESMNSDKPYDQFVRDQIAGDQLGDHVGTGFIVAGPHDIVKSPDINLTLMQRQDELADIVNVTGTTFLGLTVGCARCHDHKFDPISQKDFYSMQAIFAGVNHGERALPLSQESAGRVEEIRSQIGGLKEKLIKFVRKDGHALLVLNDQQDNKDRSAQGFRELVKSAGVGTNPAGNKRGHKDDPGSADRSPNVSGGQYTWWGNQPGKWLATYNPERTGTYRIWISWGAGHASHSKDATYELDLDGDLETADDRKIIAVVDQTRFADGTGGVTNQSLWSGFKDAGTHELREHSRILLKSGSLGTATTADVMVLEYVARSDEQDPRRQPPFRPAVQAKRNVETFPPTKARYIRFSINATNVSQPCVDELEIFAGNKNVALASQGAKASSGGDFIHALHKLEHINDGQYGNSKSWIAKDVQGWVQIELPAPQNIDRIEWARDRHGRFVDRLATQYRFEVALEQGKWHTVASSADRMPMSQSQQHLPYDFARFSPQEAKQGRQWLDKLQALEKQLGNMTAQVNVYAGTFSRPAATHRLYRGDPLQKREQVQPDTLENLGELNLEMNSSESNRRVAFARWLTQKNNPLLARVMVNRIWQHHFGQGIVATPNDFGKSGRPPTHPELLDWLANELVESGWSLKHIHRLILTSHTFVQSSRPNSRGMERDASSQFLWRFPPRRMEAESIRDAILSASGVLDHQVGGKGFDGFEVQLENVRHFFPKSQYGPADWRRMIYMTKVRQEKDSVFGAFDCPDASQIIDRRSRSTTPLQSLNLLNSQFVLQQADLMAKRLEKEARQEGLSPVDVAYRIVYSRPATKTEIENARLFVDEYGLKAFCRAILNSNEFLFIQ